MNNVIDFREASHDALRVLFYYFSAISSKDENKRSILGVLFWGWSSKKAWLEWSKAGICVYIKKAIPYLLMELRNGLRLCVYCMI